MRHVKEVPETIQGSITWFYGEEVGKIIHNCRLNHRFDHEEVGKIVCIVNWNCSKTGSCISVYEYLKSLDEKLFFKIQTFLHDWVVGTIYRVGGGVVKKLVEVIANVDVWGAPEVLIIKGGGVVKKLVEVTANVDVWGAAVVLSSITIGGPKKH